MVELTPARVVVRSLAPLNPLRVNGQPVRDQELAPGDIIQVGLTRLRVETKLAVCYVCRGSDPELSAAAESDGRLLEFSEIAVYAHRSCLAVDPEVAGPALEGVEIQRKIGGGGFGVVWLGYEPRTSRVWAIKEMRKDVLHAGSLTGQTSFAKRFQREGRFLSEFVHPRVVRCIDIRESKDGGVCLLCEFVVGEDLGQFLRRHSLEEFLKGHSTQPADWTIDVMLQVLDALACLHTSRGVIVHRDVKPENILLKHPVDPLAVPEVKLADLGISRALEGPGSTRLTETGMVIGTPQFIAPEVLQGLPYTPAADIYSVGATAYYVLTGRYPSNPPISLRKRSPQASNSLVEAIDTACRSDPDERFQTAESFAAALADARGGRVGA